MICSSSASLLPFWRFRGLRAGVSKAREGQCSALGPTLHEGVVSQLSLVDVTVGCLHAVGGGQRLPVNAREERWAAVATAQVA